MNLFEACALLACSVLLIRIFWACTLPLPAESEIDPSTPLEDLRPRHMEHFPQLRQSLDAGAQGEGLPGAPRPSRLEWRKWRRSTLGEFLTGLGGDFARMLRTLQILEGVSAVPEHLRKEIHSSKLRFRVNYRVARALIATGIPDPMGRVRRLTEILGNISSHIDACMESSGLLRDSVTEDARPSD
jgi:hypothetical protein